MAWLLQPCHGVATTSYGLRPVGPLRAHKGRMAKQSTPFNSTNSIITSGSTNSYISGICDITNSNISHTKSDISTSSTDIMVHTRCVAYYK